MFTPVQMDYRPPATGAAQGSTPAPVPAATSGVASSIVDAPATAPPSVGPASPHDGSPGEDGANGHGGARRPGNLWTAEDREDMFNRRERGEGWETICADYPNRSRHAMQQQYSMMKKQKALADGTWASNRRGRKRRNPAAPERPSAAAKRAEQYAGDIDDNMTEVDEMEDVVSEEPDDSDADASGRGLTNGRPNALMRSATEPASNKKARGAAAAVQPHNGLGSDPNGTGSIRHQLETLQEQSSAYAPPNRKKRRLSADRASNATPPVEMSQPGAGNIVLNQEDLLALLRKGSDWARRSSKALDDERASQGLMFDQALSRANKRATEAQEKFSYASFEHGEMMKKARVESSELLKTKSREHKDYIAKLRSEHEERLAILARKTEELNRESERLRKDAPTREREMHEEITQLRGTVQKLTEAKATWEATAKAEVGTLAPTRASPTAPPPADPQQQSFQHLEAKAYRSSRDVLSDAERSASIVLKFNEEFEELGHKRQMQYLADFVSQSQAHATLVKAFCAKFDAMHHALAASELAQSSPAPYVPVSTAPAASTALPSVPVGGPAHATLAAVVAAAAPTSNPLGPDAPADIAMEQGLHDGHPSALEARPGQADVPQTDAPLKQELPTAAPAPVPQILVEPGEDSPDVAMADSTTVEPAAPSGLGEERRENTGAWS